MIAVRLEVGPFGDDEDILEFRALGTAVRDFHTLEAGQADLYALGRARSAVDSALVHTLEDSSMSLGLEQMAPQDSEYAVLRRDYTRYRGYAAQGGWSQIYTGVSITELQSRLEAEGYVVNGDSAVAALKKQLAAQKGSLEKLITKQKGILATLTAPGLWLQRITTKPPSDAQAAVAIRALEGAMALEEQQGGQLVIA